MKAERKRDAAWAKVSVVLERIADDPVWRDEEFWATRWPAMVDRAAELTERAANP